MDQGDTSSSQSDQPDAANSPRLLVESVDEAVLVSFPRRKIDGVAVREIYELEAELSEDRNPKLLIDLDGIPMISSGVLGIFAATHKLFLHCGGQFHINITNELVEQQFHLMNMHIMLKLFSRRDESAAAFK